MLILPMGIGIDSKAIFRQAHEYGLFGGGTLTVVIVEECVFLISQPILQDPRIYVDTYFGFDA